MKMTWDHVNSMGSIHSIQQTGGQCVVSFQAKGNKAKPEWSSNNFKTMISSYVHFEKFGKINVIPNVSPDALYTIITNHKVQLCCS